MAALALDLGALARKMARMRDKGDKIVASVKDFASAESGSLRKSLEGLGECLSAVENSQQLQVYTMCVHSGEGGGGGGMCFTVCLACMNIGGRVTMERNPFRLTRWRQRWSNL